MKKLLFAAALVLLATSAFAELKYKGQGPSLTFDPTSFTPEMAKKYEIMAVKCNNAACHTMERSVVAVRDGILPISKTPFDKEAAKAYGVKMMRRQDSGIGQKEAKVIVELLYYLIDERTKH